MRGLVQRVTSASVHVDAETVGEIGSGLMVLPGVTHDDTTDKSHRLADKILCLTPFGGREVKPKLSRERGG